MGKRNHRKRRLRKAQLIAAKAQPAELIPLAGALSINAAAGEDESHKGPRRYEMLAYGGGALVVDKYPLPVVVDLDGLECRSAKLPTYFGHHDGSDGSRLVGHSDTHEKSGGKLTVHGAISAATAQAKEVLDAHDNGFEWQASIGALPERKSLEHVPAGTTVMVNGRTFTGPILVSRRTTLRHIAILPEGADNGTSLTIAASAANEQGEISMEFQEWLEAMFGGEVPELNDKQKATLLARFEKEKADAPPIEGKAPTGPAEPVFDVAEIVAMHATHVATIDAKAGEYEGKIDATKLAAIQAKARADASALKVTALDQKKPSAWLEVGLVKAQAEAEKELFKASLSTAPAIHTSTRDVSGDVIEAALCRSIGLPKPEDHFSEETLEASAKHFRNFGLQEFLLLAAAQNGYTGRPRIGRDNLREIMQYCFPIHAAGVSTIDVAGILSNTGNKSLLSGFNTVPQTWREVAAVATVSDFKQVTRYRLTADLEYEEVGPTGEIHHGELGEESYTAQAKTYAKMLALTRTDIINDDLGAFNQLRMRLGIGAVIKMAKVFWTLWINNSAFFTTARGNYQTGAATALGETGLNTAVQLFRDMKGPDGNLLGLEPDRIVVPTALEATAKKWYQSTEVRDTTASTKTPVANIHQGSFRPVPIPELGSSAYTGYSAKAWYLLCDPAILATAEMCFLDGEQAPTVESADADFNTLGIQLRGYHDFGVNFAEYRAGVKSKGEA